MVVYTNAGFEGTVDHKHHDLTPLKLGTIEFEREIPLSRQQKTKALIRHHFVCCTDSKPSLVSSSQIPRLFAGLTVTPTGSEE